MDKEITGLVRGYYFSYFGAQACMASYLNVYLEQSLGFNGTALGWFNGLTTLAPAAVLPLLGCWADRTGRGGWMLTGALGAVLLGAGLLGLQVGFAGALLWGLVWEVARSACVSLADKCSMELCGARGRRYGSVRAFGSLGFLAGGMAMGFAAQHWDLGRVLFPCYLLLVATAGGLSFAFHRPGRALPPGQGRIGSLGQLFRRPAFRLALLLGVQGSVAVSALQPYLGNHLVTTMGASPAILSWNTLCCVGPELLLLPLVGGPGLARWGLCRTSMLVTLALAVRCAVYALAPSPELFLAGSLLYGFSVCGYTAVNLTLLRRVVPPEHYAAAVLTNAAVSTLGRAAFSWLFGVLYQHWGSGSIFWLLLWTAFGMLVLLWRGRNIFPAET